MKKYSIKITGLLLASLLFVQSAQAFCVWIITPPGRDFHPKDATETLLSFEDGVQTLVVRPEFEGNGEEFGIVFPTPTRPQIIDAPKGIFEELNNATNPIKWQPMPLSAEGFDATVVRATNVTVIETVKAGSYIATVLGANDSGALVEWLKSNGYAYTEKDTQKMDFYIKKGFYFIALKVNVEKVKNETGGIVYAQNGEARLSAPIIAPSDEDQEGFIEPISITFKTPRPMLPMRSLTSDMPVMTFDLYTLGTTPYVLSGVDTYYAQVVSSEFMSQVPSLGIYNPKGKFLVRQEVKFDPKKIYDDVYLDSPTTIRKGVTPDSPKRFGLSAPAGSGILSGTKGLVVLSDGSSVRFSRTLKKGSYGIDVKYLQIFLNSKGFTIASEGEGSKGNEGMYFGEKTKQALIRFQNANRDSLKVYQGTGVFGPATQKLVKAQYE